MSNNLSPKLAFVFPGQGSQSRGMLAEIAKEHAVVEQTFLRASDVLGFDLWDLVLNDLNGTLNKTENTQPALLTASIALWQIWNDIGGVKPSRLAGHSLGEYSALVAAGSLSFEDGVKIVKERGRLMQEAVPEGKGAMAAILGLEDSKIQEACLEAAENQVLAPVNFNAIGQTVIAGNAEAVERAIALCKSMGAKRAVILPVSVPSHCALMEPAAIQLKEILKSVTFKAPIIPVIHNVDVAQHATADEIKQALCEQLTSPVRWVETIQGFAESGITQAVECGPGKVLAGLIKRIDKSIQVFASESPADLQTAVSETNK